jgi:hypothetical protein
MPKCKYCGEESGNHDCCKECLIKKQKMSEGEEMIKELFEEEGIDYEFQKEIPNLVNDKKEFRIADFYIPQYKVYLEFFGNWNNPEKREEYKLKKRVYKENNIPCVYIYPENLGFLNKVLKRRIKKVLQDHKELRWQLFQLNWDIFIEKFGLIELLLILFILYAQGILWKIGLFVLLVILVFNSLKKSFFRKIE